MAKVQQVRFVRTASSKNDNHIAFEDSTTGDVKLNKITRTEVDTIVSQNKQQDIIKNAQTILSKPKYGNGSVTGIQLYADQEKSIVRLSISVRAAGKSWLYMGRVDSGKWVACANTPVEIDGDVDELQHINGNSHEVNIVLTSNRSFYCEGH